MLSIIKTGQILLHDQSKILKLADPLKGDQSLFPNDKVVCNRPGIVIDVVVDDGTKFAVSPMITNPYTISIASQGILLSFYSIKKKMLSEYDIDLAWFVDYEYAYFLSTSDKIDGYICYWKEGDTFGDIFLSITKEEEFQGLDKNNAYIFLLDTNKTITLSYLYKSCDGNFIIPSKCNVPKFCNTPKFISEQFIENSQRKLTTEEKTTPLLFNQSQALPPGLQGLTTGSGARLQGLRSVNLPLLVNIYSDMIYCIRIISKNDMITMKIKSRSTDKYMALLIAHFKNENIDTFLHNNFTKQEITTFNTCLLEGFERFKYDIYKKCQHKWVQFPDKLFNTIRLGDILMSKLTIEEKQVKSIEELKRCTFSWKLKALYEFYKFYMKIENVF
jgi:hypothetical protein